MNGLYRHTHGGDASGQLLDFSVNITPIAPPIWPIEFDAHTLSRYPSIDGSAIRDFYSERFGLDPSSVLPTSGAVEGIYLLPRALGLKRVLLFSPSFFEYERASRIAGADVVKLPLLDEDGFAAPTIDAIARALEGCDALFIGNPNNPTGTMLAPEDILKLSEWFPDQWLLLDEAFIQYDAGFPGNSWMHRLGDAANVIVIHSLTKFYALPALRLGALIAHPELIRRLLDYKEPWTVNAVAEIVAAKLSACHAWEDGVRRMLLMERRRMQEAFSLMPKAEIRGGAANFFLARWLDGPLEQLTEALGHHGIHLRDCRNFDGLQGEWFRFAVRTPEENGRFLDAMLEVAC